MAFKETLQHGFDSILNKAGNQVMFRYFNETIGSVWDDETTLAISGEDLWTSGVIMPLDSREGSHDSVLMEQGKLIDGDKRLYVNGSLSITGSDTIFKVLLGSQTIISGLDAYTTIPLGAIAPEAQGEKIYKKVYIRRLTNGSLLGE